MIDHLNVTQLAPWLHERFLGGRLIAGQRALRWPWWMRLFYIVGSPLIRWSFCGGSGEACV